MHEWTLIALLFEWKEARVTLTFLNQNAANVSLIAEKVSVLSVPKRNEWGPSVSVNTLEGPILQSDGTSVLRIEMQSGDVIEITADSFIKSD
jgi:hypothetical protein